MNSTPFKSPSSLTGAQRRALRALGHHLRPIVRIGQHGLSHGVVQAAAAALEDHELVKISFRVEDRAAGRLLPGELANATGAHVAQILGHTALLYRRHIESPKLDLPGPIDEATPPDGSGDEELSR